jgi:metallo-beta-lactamase family protein
MHKKPSLIKIVHGDDDAKNALAAKYKEVLGNDVEVEIGE